MSNDETAIILACTGCSLSISWTVSKAAHQPIVLVARWRGQADVFGPYLAYTDHEIGRVIQAVENLRELDNTLIIYIAGDNGASAEGMLDGTPNEFTTFNGVAVPVKDQFLWYPFWGSARTYPHFAAPWAWAMDTPFKWMKQVASHFDGTAQA